MTWIHSVSPLNSPPAKPVLNINIYFCLFVLFCFVLLRVNPHFYLRQGRLKCSHKNLSTLEINVMVAHVVAHCGLAEGILYHAVI